MSYTLSVLDSDGCTKITMPCEDSEEIVDIISSAQDALSLDDEPITGMGLKVWLLSWFNSIIANSLTKSYSIDITDVAKEAEKIYVYLKTSVDNEVIDTTIFVITSSEDNDEFVALYETLKGLQ